jgi:hypothetical protein
MDPDKRLSCNPSCWYSVCRHGTAHGFLILKVTLTLLLIAVATLSAAAGHAGRRARLYGLKQL